MADGSIRIETTLDNSSLKQQVKELEKELKNIQKEQAKTEAQAGQARAKYDAEREFDSQFPEEFSHREDIDARAAKELDPIIAKQEELNQKEQEYLAKLDAAKAKLAEQANIADASKQVDLDVKAESSVSKIKTQEQYNSLLEQTKEKMAAIEAAAEREAAKRGLSTEQILAANEQYQKLSDTMDMLKAKAGEFGDKGKDAGKKTGDGLKKAKNEAKGLGDEVTKGVKKLGAMSLAIFGIRGAYRAVRMAASEYLSTNEELAGQVEAMKSVFAQVLGPAIEFVINLLLKAISVVNAFVYALTGINFIARANEAALKKQATAAASANSTAGFDEQTKLSDGAGGSGGSAVATLPDGSNMDISFLDPVVNAFKKFSDDMKPFMSTVGDALKWLYDEVLVPLGEWVATSFLPVGLELISSAFGALNEVLIALEPMAEWLWDNFLRPIAEWTGGAIIDILSTLADLLDGFATWVSENQGAVEGITIVVGAFMAVWAITDLIMWIDAAGGIIGVLKLIRGEVVKNTIAKLADKAEDIAIIALYAKDYIVAFVGVIAKLAMSTAAWVANTAAKAASTAAEWLQIAATTAWNVICTVATALTTAFGAAIAFLTSPIGLVILAIAALIAIVVLIITYWDEISAAAVKCWEWIKETWNKVAEWFDTNVIQPVIGFFRAAGEAIGAAFVAAWEWIKETWNKVAAWFDENIVKPVAKFFVGMWDGLINGAKVAWDGIKNVFSKVGSFFTDIFKKAWEGVKNVFSVGGKIFDGIKDGIVTAFKVVVNGIITGINKVVKVPFEGLNGILNTIHGIEIAGIQPFSWLTWRAPIPQLPKLARGGIVNRPGRGVPAIIGEAGSEAILPLENNTEWMDILADKIGGGTITIPITLDGKRIATYIVDIQKKKAFAMNGA